MATRRAVLGDAHVDRAEAATTDFDAAVPGADHRGGLGPRSGRARAGRKRERSIVTIALLAALGHDDEVAMHVRATANTGATRDDVREALLHVAIYAGVPAANTRLQDRQAGVRGDGRGARPNELTVRIQRARPRPAPSSRATGRGIRRR